MSRSRVSRTLGALVASVGLVLSGSLTAQAAGSDSITVTVRMVDEDTGKLIDGKLQYWSDDDVSVVFDSGTPVTIAKDDFSREYDGVVFLGPINFASGTELGAKYEVSGRSDIETGGNGCIVRLADAGKTVTCTAEKMPYSTTLKAVDEDGNSIKLEADDFAYYSYKFYGETFYYDDNYASAINSVEISKPGYLTEEVTPLVNGGTTRLTLRKIPTREVTFKFVDAADGSTGLTDVTATITLLRDDYGAVPAEKYSVTHGEKVTLPDYRSEDSDGRAYYEATLNSSTRIRSSYFDSYTSDVRGLLSDVTTVEIPIVRVKVVDENGNPVENATVKIVDTVQSWYEQYSGGWYENLVDVSVTPVPPEEEITIATRADSRVSNGDDIFYVPLVSSGRAFTGFPLSNASTGVISLVSIDVQAPEGYENPASVNFFHKTMTVLRKDADELSYEDAVGITDDDRVSFVTRDGTDGDREQLGEVVTVKLKKKPAVLVSSVKMSGASSVEVGKSVQLSATVSPSNASNKAVAWSSSDTSVATVDANGKVTGKKAGTVTITATAKDGSGKSGSLKMTVVAKPAPSPSPTVTPSPTSSPTPTTTPSVKPTSSPKPSVSPSPSVKPSPSSSPSPSVPVGQCSVKSGPASFRDVPASHSFVKDISWLSQRGITTGWADGTFRPSESVTRAAFAAFLYRMAGCPSYTPPKVSPFVDVPTSHQFYREISWLASKSVTRGWPDGTFRPEAKIQRDALSTFLYRFAGEPKFTATKSFRDTATSEHKKAIDWFASTGISTGWSDGTFRPSNETERAAIAAFLHRFSDKKIPIAVR